MIISDLAEVVAREIGWEVNGSGTGVCREDGAAIRFGVVSTIAIVHGIWPRSTDGTRFKPLTPVKSFCYELSRGVPAFFEGLNEYLGRYLPAYEEQLKRCAEYEAPAQDALMSIADRLGVGCEPYFDTKNYFGGGEFTVSSGGVIDLTFDSLGKEKALKLIDFYNTL